jgi:hypothetical protein
VEVKTIKRTHEELIAQADAQFGDGVEKSGGNSNSRHGTFIQDERGSSIAGSSIEHKPRRDIDRADETLWQKRGLVQTGKDYVSLDELTAKAYKNQV